MKREMKHTWLSKEDFLKANPRNFAIVGFAVDGETANDLVLIDGGDGIRKWSLSQKLNNLLIGKYGDDDSGWIGKVISVQQTMNDKGEYRRSVSGV